MKMGKTRVHTVSRVLIGTFVSIFVLLSINVQGDEWTTKHDIETADYPSVDGDLIIKSNTTTIKSGGVLIVNGNMTIKSTTTIESGGTLIVNGNLDVLATSGIYFNVTGSIIVNGNLTIKSTTNINLGGEITVNRGDVVITNTTLTVKGLLYVAKGDLTVDGDEGTATLTLYDDHGGNEMGRVVVSDRIKVEDDYEQDKNKGNFNLISHGNKCYAVLNYYGGDLYVYNNYKQDDNHGGDNGDKKYTLINSNANGRNYSEIYVGGDYIIEQVDRHKTDIVGNTTYLPFVNVSGKVDDKISDDHKNLIHTKDISISALLPIELTSFIVSATEYGYTFNWVTASEVENDYFTLEFSENGEEFIPIDYVSGAGTTSETTEYEYVWDANPTAEILYFRLKQTDYNGEFTYSDILVYAPKKSHGATRTLYYGPLKLNVVDGQLQYIVE